MGERDTVTVEASGSKPLWGAIDKYIVNKIGGHLTMIYKDEKLKKENMSRYLSKEHLLTTVVIK